MLSIFIHCGSYDHRKELLIERRQVIAQINHIHIHQYNPRTERIQQSQTERHNILEEINHLENSITSNENQLMLLKQQNNPDEKQLKQISSNITKTQNTLQNRRAFSEHLDLEARHLQQEIDQLTIHLNELENESNHLAQEIHNLDPNYPID